MKDVFFLGLLLLVLPGCRRLVNWGKETFNQGTDIELSTEAAERYMRSAHVYDQLRTAAIFDALWLSDELRTAYANTHSAWQGRGEEQQTAFLRRQLAENSRYISFFVLSLHQVSLTKQDPTWSLFLKIDDEQFVPVELKETELDAIYKKFLGKRWTRFKVPYLVKFDAIDVDEKPLITPQTRTLTLTFRSATKEASLKWHLSNMRVRRKVRRRLEKKSQCDHRFDVFEEF